MSAVPGYTVDLAPGLVLHVEQGADEALAERVMAFVDRDANVDMVKSNVERLVERDSRLGLEHTLDVLGYSNNMTQATSAELGAAILALLPIVALDRVLQVAEVSNFEVARSHGARAESADDFHAEWALAGVAIRDTDPAIRSRVVALLEEYASREWTTMEDFEALRASMASLHTEAVAS